jgi:hypothetical protein
MGRGLLPAILSLHYAVLKYPAYLGSNSVQMHIFWHGIWWDQCILDVVECKLCHTFSLAWKSVVDVEYSIIDDVVSTSFFL